MFSAGNVNKFGKMFTKCRCFGLDHVNKVKDLATV